MPYALGRTIANTPAGGAPKTGAFVQSVIDEIRANFDEALWEPRGKLVLGLQR
jgi:hypothetical protein